MRLVHAPPQKCARKLARGEVKRCMARGRVLVGYHVACPACGWVASHLREHHDFLEGPWDRTAYELVDEVTGAKTTTIVHHPMTLTAMTPLRCPRCAALITIIDNAIEAA